MNSFFTRKLHLALDAFIFSSSSKPLNLKNHIRSKNCRIHSIEWCNPRYSIISRSEMAIDKKKPSSIWNGKKSHNGLFLEKPRSSMARYQYINTQSESAWIYRQILVKTIQPWMDEGKNCPDHLESGLVTIELASVFTWNGTHYSIANDKIAIDKFAFSLWRNKFYSHGDPSSKRRFHTRNSDDTC